MVGPQKGDRAIDLPFLGAGGGGTVLQPASRHSGPGALKNPTRQDNQKNQPSQGPKSTARYLNRWKGRGNQILETKISFKKKKCTAEAGGGHHGRLIPGSALSKLRKENEYL